LQKFKRAGERDDAFDIRDLRRRLQDLGVVVALGAAREMSPMLDARARREPFRRVKPVLAAHGPTRAQRGVESQALVQVE